MDSTMLNNPGYAPPVILKEGDVYLQVLIKVAGVNPG